MPKFEDFKNAIGQQFKIKGNIFKGKYDTIIAITEDCWVVGNFMSAHYTDCALKQAQPEHLKKQKHRIE